MGYSPSGTDCYSVGPPWGHRTWQKTCSRTSSSPQAVAPGSSHLLCGLSMGCTRTTCLTRVFSTGCRGSSALAPGALLPSSSLTLVLQGCFSHIFPHSSLPCSVLPFIKYIFPEVPPLWPRGSAVPCGGVGWSWLGPAVSGAGQPRPLLSPRWPPAALAARDWPGKPGTALSACFPCLYLSQVN